MIRYNKQGVRILDPGGYNGNDPMEELPKCQHNWSCKDHHNRPIIITLENELGKHVVPGEMCLFPGCGKRRLAYG